MRTSPVSLSFQSNLCASFFWIAFVRSRLCVPQIPWLPTVVRDILMPTLSWRAGKVAAALRHHAFLALNALLDRHILENILRTHTDLIANLLPVVQSGLDDFDPKIRLAACQALRGVLAMLPRDPFSVANAGYDGEMVLTNLYRELLKRLDDSDDTIRVDAALSLQHLVRVVHAGYDRVHYQYLVRGLLVHLDDPNPRIQDAVFASLCAWRHFDAPVFFPEVKHVRDKHSSPEYCDRLLALAP